ncbi:MAG TPA: TadE family protein [Candidatus Sulfotelmatobacter sp.]|nr:TadE family protein [Candidatus Sulfotelmatobacter sp.]
MSRAQLVHDERAAQIVEFAVALPLLVVFVVGIFDFSTAFTFKQRLTNMARDAAHVAASDPSNDVLPGGATPGSVVDVFQIAENYLLVNNVNDCGLKLNPAPSGVTWTFTATGNGCPSPGLEIVVNRGYYFPANGGALPTDCLHPTASAGVTTVVATCVSIRYPYPWKFGRAASLLGFNDTLPAQITAIGVSMNED